MTGSLPNMIEKAVQAEREACAKAADDVAAARYLAGDMEGWGTASQIAKFIRERSRPSKEE